MDPDREFSDLLKAATDEGEMLNAVKLMAKTVITYHRELTEGGIDEMSATMLTAAFQASLMGLTPPPEMPS